MHTDTACLLTSPAEFYREPNGRVGRYSFTGYREVHDVMTANGDGGKGIWMTEIGWNTGSRKPGSCRDGAVAGTRAEGVSEKTQARFLELAYRCLAADPAVRVALWFSLQDVGEGAGYGDHLGLIRKGGKRKPAYRAMRKVRNGKIGAARCGGRSDRAAPSLAVSRPTEGAVFTDRENLPMRVTARDNRGGTGMRRVELHVDGRHVRTWGGGKVRSSWFGFRQIGYGDHAVEIHALDEAKNVTVRRLTIRKVPPSSLGDSAAPRVRWRSLPERAGASLRLAVRARRSRPGRAAQEHALRRRRARAHDRAPRRPVAPARAPARLRQAPPHAARGGPRGQRHALQALRDAPLGRGSAGGPRTGGQAAPRSAGAPPWTPVARVGEAGRHEHVVADRGGEGVRPRDARRGPARVS